MAELLIARNPDPDSTLPYLLRVPTAGGLVFRTSGTWPRTKALFCYPVDLADWPAEPEIVERVPLVSCGRNGAAIDVIADRRTERRSQIVHTRARGREMVFWQSPNTRKQARPQVRTPTARAAGTDGELEIVVDSHERYAYRFAGQQVRVRKQALSCGDYGVVVEGRVVAAVERKSLSDLVSSLTNSTLRHAVAELATLPRAAVVVEERYSRVFALEYVRPAVVADGIAELAVRYPTVPIIFTETRGLAEEWTYRFLAAASTWAQDEAVIGARIPGAESALDAARTAPEPTTAQVRAWARDAGLDVPDRGRLRPEIWERYRAAH
ncbi:ERCC4 domain-containing protein [Actinomycetospora termitidis]|uniref:ERCC4 domain-containing protein n=1 Tax=Actinomycetospora termitidis TaxID=3053470 RepID=A0ABT7M181_9PSEU|nr:histone-like nucleoid-structuring protein Lsr2 [Actinomycetospora sp. Odt1-22]MDL5154415.1 ERCC4 domain-containing protein [Actinomycetospora sp. Odt1-22]